MEKTLRQDYHARKLIIPQLNEHILPAGHQHGFRKWRCTTTALRRVQPLIQNGLNSQRPHERTIMVAIDMLKAFDKVNHRRLLNLIEDWVFN